jgi:cyclase
MVWKNAGVSHPHLDMPIPDPVVEEVADGVFAYLQLDGQWGLNNSGFLVGSDGVTLIDTCFTEKRTRGLLGAVEQVARQPVRTLINTHEHGDHTWGNWLVAGATIIGHERCRTGMLESGLVAQAIFPGVDWGRIELRPPSVTFTDRLEVWIDDLAMELIAVGPAHTPSDVVGWLPDQRVLFAGDTVFHHGTPFVLMGSVAGSLAAQERLAALDASVIVPGHGPVGDARALADQVEYLRFVQDLAARGVDAGLTPLQAALEARASGELGRFEGWHDPERLVGNLLRAYAERDGAAPGAPIDMSAGVAGMVEFNGGQPLRCLA